MKYTAHRLELAETFVDPKRYHGLDEWVGRTRGYGRERPGPRPGSGKAALPCGMDGLDRGSPEALPAGAGAQARMATSREGGTERLEEGPGANCWVPPSLATIHRVLAHTGPSGSAGKLREGTHSCRLPHAHGQTVTWWNPGQATVAGGGPRSPSAWPRHRAGPQAGPKVKNYAGPGHRPKARRRGTDESTRTTFCCRRACCPSPMPSLPDPETLEGVETVSFAYGITSGQQADAAQSPTGHREPQPLPPRHLPPNAPGEGQREAPGGRAGDDPRRLSPARGPGRICAPGLQGWVRPVIPKMVS